jgi:hypothetical protein
VKFGVRIPFGLLAGRLLLRRLAGPGCGEHVLAELSLRGLDPGVQVRGLAVDVELDAVDELGGRLCLRAGQTLLGQGEPEVGLLEGVAPLGGELLAVLGLLLELLLLGEVVGLERSDPRLGLSGGLLCRRAGFTLTLEGALAGAQGSRQASRPPLSASRRLKLPRLSRVCICGQVRR